MEASIQNKVKLENLLNLNFGSSEIPENLGNLNSLFVERFENLIEENNLNQAKAFQLEYKDNIEPLCKIYFNEYLIF